MTRKSEKEGKAAISPSNSSNEYNSDIKKFHEIASKIKEKYSLNNYDLIDMLLKKKADKPIDMIPVSIFDNNKLGCLEAVVKYMKENLKLKSSKIAEMLGRNISTISSTYIKACKKHSSEFFVKESKHYIPIAVIANRNFSVMESIVKFLKEKLNLANKEIAKMLNRDTRTIWTVYSRAAKKGGSE